MTAQSGAAALEARPTVADLHGDNHFAKLAHKTWLNKKKAPKVNSKVVKEELWEQLEKDGFAYSELLILETLQALEK
jgi:intron-binding protein aquarius